MSSPAAGDWTITRGGLRRELSKYQASTLRNEANGGAENLSRTDGTASGKG
jgi:hypothetical protein